jgi:hypothetical protein
MYFGMRLEMVSDVIDEPGGQGVEPGNPSKPRKRSGEWNVCVLRGESPKPASLHNPMRRLMLMDLFLNHGSMPLSELKPVDSTTSVPI